jgi:alpha-galactosidase
MNLNESLFFAAKRVVGDALVKSRSWSFANNARNLSAIDRDMKKTTNQCDSLHATLQRVAFEDAYFHLKWMCKGQVGLRALSNVLIILFFFVGSAVSALSQTTAPDLISSDLWKPAHVPFSFTYGGKKSEQILTTWHTSEENITEGTYQIHRYTYTDPTSQLKITADVRLFPDYPGAVDWVLRFRNNGTSDTPIIEDILPLNSAIKSSTGDSFIRHDQGSDDSAQDFKPLEERLSPDQSVHLESPGGDSSSRNTLPFFNLQTGDHGLIGAIGWTGGWKADFSYAMDGRSIVMTSGMKRTHLLLHPGEEIRTPRIVLMRWTGGDWRDSQNIWRRFLLAHYTPQDNNKPLRGPILFGSWGSEAIDSKIAYIHWVHDHQIPVELYTVDAGWYSDSFGAEGFQDDHPWWKYRGDWFPSPRYYPNGIKPLGDALKAAGFGFSLWVEPETSMPDRKIIKDHPDWYLHSDRPVHFGGPLAAGASVAKLGNPETLKGITDMLSGFITDFGMTWYRQDFNTPPEHYWELADTPDRIGMTEIGHIEGLYKMWDELLARHPGLRIDNCASGGRRIDIEMMSRSFIVWRTDHGFHDTLAEQAQTQALAPWVPETEGFETYSPSKPWTKPGPYSTPESLYLMRLAYNVGYAVTPGAAGVDNDAWVAWIKQALDEYREVQPYFYEDFYPLLPYSLDAEAWTAWQWNRPAKKDGLVIVLRRPKSPFITMELGLKHLDPNVTYEVEIRTTYDKAPLKEMKGSDLARLQIKLTDMPSSLLIFYRQK